MIVSNCVPFPHCPHLNYISDNLLMFVSMRAKTDLSVLFTCVSLVLEGKTWQYQYTFGE